MTDSTVNLSDLINEVYTPLSEIEKILPQRRQDEKLKKDVEDFFGEYFLPEFRKGPRAVISRPVISPNKEFRYFLDISSDLGLDPIALEYPDKFVAKNLDKYHLARLLMEKEEKKGGRTFKSIKLVNFNEAEGKNFREILTVTKEPLVGFHHDLLLKEFPEMESRVIDISEWFQETRYKSKYYYLYFLSLFICHGVLFENFLFKDKGESEFFLEKVWPSFQEVERIFGVKPLIFPLLPVETEKDRAWLSYQDHIKSHVEKKLNNGVV
jgi:hypothetical protein